MRRDRVILHGRTEFVAYLLVDGINDLLTRKHTETWRSSAQRQPICLARRSLSGGGFVDGVDDFLIRKHGEILALIRRMQTD
jgi:hypothetical protein